MKTKHKLNHLLHLVLTFISFGLWAIVWTILVLRQFEHFHQEQLDAQWELVRALRGDPET